MGIVDDKLARPLIRADIVAYSLGPRPTFPIGRNITECLAGIHRGGVACQSLAIGPCVVITRFLRNSVARVAASDFVTNMRAWGLPEAVVRKRALRNGLSPVVTLIGTLLPLLVSGSVVVEQVFSLPGMGRLAFGAVLARDQGMVMALTLLVSVVTLLGLLLSDLLQRTVDPRVRLR